MNKNSNPPHLTKGTLILRTVVSLYLLYTVYQLSPSLKTATGNDLIFAIAAMVIFTGIAVPLAGFSIKALVKGEYMDPTGADSQEELTDEEFDETKMHENKKTENSEIEDKVSQDNAQDDNQTEDLSSQNASDNNGEEDTAK